MLKSGDKVKLVYYEREGQTESGNWLVEGYNNGLLKVTRGASAFERVVLERAGREPSKKKIVVFNLRSIGFLKAELEEQ